MVTTSGNQSALWAFRIGVIIVLVTHLYMLFFGLPPAQMIGHAILNLGATILLLLGWRKK